MWGLKLGITHYSHVSKMTSMSTGRERGPCTQKRAELCRAVVGPTDSTLLNPGLLSDKQWQHLTPNLRRLWMLNGVRKSITNSLCKKLSDEVLAWLSVWSEVQRICVWSSCCHCHPIVSRFIKIQIDLTFLVPAYPDCRGKDRGR